MSICVIREETWVIAPLICLSGGAVLVYLIARLRNWREDVHNAALATITALVMITALATLLPLIAIVGTERDMPISRLPTWGHTNSGPVFLRADPGAVTIVGVAIGLGLLVTVYSGRYLALDRRYETYYPLLLLLIVGLSGMTLAADLFSLYLFCELMSIAVYVLVAFRRHTDTAIEAGFKYLVMGSLGTMLILLGISFIYRETGSLALPTIAPSAGPWTRAGLACLLVGLGIKSAIVPLHTWLPDAHGRAPSSVSAMLSGIVIQGTLYVLIKTTLGLGLRTQTLGTLLIALSWLNMGVGNSMALMQTHVKRLLAYSSIAQMGYLMFAIGVGLHSNLPEAIRGGFFLLLAHAIGKGLAFLCKGVSHFYCDTTTVTQLRGTAHRLPAVAVAMSVSLGGLAAVPPLAGFAGKWLVLVNVAHADNWPARIGIVVMLANSLVSLAYYLPLILVLFTPPVTAGEKHVRISSWMALPLLVLSGMAIAIGIYPMPWWEVTANVGTYLLTLGK